MGNYVTPYDAGSSTGASQRAGTPGYTGSSSAPAASPATTPGNSNPAAPPNNLSGPGSVDVNLTDPVASAQDATQQTNDLLGGLKAFLFGTDNPDAQGQHGGALSNIPVVGDALSGVARGALNAASVVGAPVLGAAGHAADIVGGALERLPMGDTAAIQAAFDALPPDSPEKQAAQAAMAKEGGSGGILGSSFGSDFGHIMADAIDKYQTNNASTLKPDLFNGLFHPAASIADAVGNLFGVLGAAQRITERQVTGMGTRLQDIMAVGDGQGVFNGVKTGSKFEDATGLTPIEQTVFNNVRSGLWTDAQAMDFLASHGAGESHNPIAEIAANIVLDPLNLATAGAGTIAKVGETGVELAKILEAAQTGLSDATKALDVAQAAGDAEKAASAAADVETYTKAVAEAQTGVKASGTSRAFNVIGKLKETDTAGDIARSLGGAYEAIGATSIGKMAKVVRAIIDPMHMLGGSPRNVEAVEAGSRDASKAMVMAHGDGEHIAVQGTLAGLAHNGDAMLKEYTDGLGIASANMFRRVVGRGYRASQMLAQFTEGLLKESPMAGIANAMKVATKDAYVQLEEEAGKQVRNIWSAGDRANLADRLDTLWGARPEGEPQWADIIGKMSGKQMSLLHEATWGTYVKQFNAAKTAVKLAGGGLGRFADRLGDLTPLNKQTLTDLGLDGLRTALKDAADDPARLKVIQQYQHDYPQLANFAMDGTSASNTVKKFTELLDRIEPHLPSQITNAERGASIEESQLPKALAEFDAKTRNVFTLGFRPKEQFLWGLEPGLDGTMHEVTDPWFDLVSDDIQGYQPIHQFAYNLAGKPLPVRLVGAAVRKLDAMESIGRTAMHGVTGTMVSQMARNNFMEQTFAKYAERGVSKDQLQAVWDTIHEAASKADSLSGPRGMSEGDMWNIAKTVVSGKMERAGLNRRAIMSHIFDAYNGDTRYIGLTQKLSGAAKAWVYKNTGQNVLGMIAEHAWPLLKFKLNPFFQIQERIEPWVLNAQRGVHLALGTKWNEADHLVAQSFKNWSEKSIVNMSDTDIAEMSKKFGFGKEMEAASSVPGSKMALFRSKMNELTNVQGSKQLNMMRTFQKGLGAEMKGVWERTMGPGEWDKMALDASARAGRRISDDDLAVRIAASNAAANDIIVKRIIGGDGLARGWQAEFANAIREGQWAEPQTLGDMRPLQLDDLFARTSLREPGTGRSLDNLAKVKQGLASGTISNDDVEQELRALDAHPDYQRRVMSALRFDYPQFWRNAKSTFSMTDEQVNRIERFYAGIAQSRGMTPLEYMSQIYAPQLSEGAVDGSLGALGRIVKGGSGMEVPDLATLVGQKGQSDIQDLYRQMAAVMTNHLDPSAKRGFLAQMARNGGLDAFAGSDPDTMEAVNAMWQAHGEGAFADQLLGFFQGQPGTGAHTLVADEATGNNVIRTLAHSILKGQDREPNLQRTVSEEAPALGQRLAEEHAAMGDQELVRIATGDEGAPAVNSVIQRATPADLTESISGDGLKAIASRNIEQDRALLPTGAIKESAWDALTPQQRSAYEAYITENRSLFNRLIAPKSQGGAGLKVVTTRGAEPYKTVEQIRTAIKSKTFKVAGKGNWHPVLSDEDNAIAKVVRQVFGYGQEDNSLGSMDAGMKASRLYSDEVRPTMLADSLAPAMYEKYSQDIIPGVEANPLTVGPANQRYGRSLDAFNVLPQSYDGPRISTSTFGPGLESATPEVQAKVLAVYNDFRNHFRVPIGTVDIGDIEDYGATTDNYFRKPAAITLNRDEGWDDPARLAQRAQTNEDFKKVVTYQNEDGDTVIRKSLLGVPKYTSATVAGDFWHELGHAVDFYLRGEAVRAGKTLADMPTDALQTVMAELKKDEFARSLMSEYAMKSVPGHVAGDVGEGFGELFDLAFNPEHAGQTFDENVQYHIDALKKALTDGGYYSPEELPLPAPHPFAGQTVAAANAAKPGAYQAPMRVGSLSPELTTDLTDHFLGNGRYASADPDMARMASATRDTMQQAMSEVLQGDTSHPIAKFLDANSGMPVIEPAHYNATEAAMRYAAQQAMVSKWQDAFRLQYFSQSRSMFQRSLNHPMFGMYPASYMWGKIGPELIRFIAAEPLGIHTGLAAYTLADMQKSVAMQRQFDPAFQQTIDGLGNNAALSFLGYLLPGTPWDVPAAAPAWMRDMAKQGLSNNAKVAAGGDVSNDNFATPLTQALSKMSPLSAYTPWAAKAIGQAESLVPNVTNLGGEPNPNPQPTSVAPSQEPNLSQPTPATGLAPTLSSDMLTLQQLLGH